MTDGSKLAIGLISCAMLVCLLGAAVAGTSGAFAQQDVDADDVLLSISIHEDGDAVWSIEYRNRLETDEEAAAFEELRADVEDDPGPYVDRFGDRMESTAATAAAETGREMTITEMTVEAERRALPQEYGVVTYTFRWSNFAAVEDERLYVGDAIDEMFLDEETTLLLSWQEGYERLDASPTPEETRERSVVYAGPTNFGSGEPRVELGPSGVPSADDGLAVSAVQIGAFVLLVTAVGVIGVFAYRRRSDAGDDTSARRPEPTNDETELDRELLSNEEQVLELLERQGGRMKQKEVAERLEWTDAKTSQVTKKLRDRGDLEGFRLGRENVLSLPGEDPRSPSDEET